MMSVTEVRPGHLNCVLCVIRPLNVEPWSGLGTVPGLGKTAVSENVKVLAPGELIFFWGRKKIKWTFKKLFQIVINPMKKIAQKRARSRRAGPGWGR